MLDKIASIKSDSSDKKIKLSFRVFDECINLETLNIRRVNFYSLIHSFNELENKQILFSENHIDTVRYFVKGINRYFTIDENGNSLNKITFLPDRINFEIFDKKFKFKFKTIFIKSNIQLESLEIKMRTKLRDLLVNFI